MDLLTLAAHLAPEPIPRTLFTIHPDRLPDPLATTARDPLAFTDLTRLLRPRRAGPRRARQSAGAPAAAGHPALPAQRA
ncbi:MAG: hypothetical protein WBF75_05020 [Pseudonocardiaceae bacterium]